MNVELREEPISALALHGTIPIAFEADRILDVSAADGGWGGLVLRERRLAPFTKDYDAIEGEGPTRWPRRFDVSNWGIISAHRGGVRAGGAVLAFDTPGVHLLEGRRDLAVLWDLRVSPGLRGGGIGTRLFAAAEDWARARSCIQLKVETQNINVPACQFYRRRGCVLGAINRFAYPDHPDEVQLLWYKALNTA